MNEMDNKTINLIRVLSAEMVQKANSGHPGLPLGAAPAVYTLWSKKLKHSPACPKWADRDRFILSAGHGSALLYSLLHMFGYPMTMEDLKSFRQWGSKTPGHPEYGHTIGVEITTGPLGQGLANGVGMAIAEAHLSAKFNKPELKLVDHYTYVFAGDGCMMEGIASEAASLAGTLGLGKLIVLYDSNGISIEGSTNLAFQEDTCKRFESYGWQVVKVEDGNDTDAISEAIEKARQEKDRPTLIEIRTVIGYGSPKEGTASVHGEPLGEENLKILRENLNLGDNPPFTVPEDVKEHMDGIVQRLNAYASDWNERWALYSETYPQLAKEWEMWHSGEIPDVLSNVPGFYAAPGKPAATRASSGEVINALSDLLPNFIGGSADLAPSNKTWMKDKGEFSRENHSGRNFHFGVREHAMAAIANGIAAHGGLIPYVSTFFVFSDYLKPTMRLSALMGLPVVYVFTHDSIGVGEDGPTHQPVEQLATLRSIPGFIDYRPADYKETLAGWAVALSRRNNPTALVLSRQNLRQLDGTGEGALRGGYILLDSENPVPELIIIASGSEVGLAVDAHAVLKKMGIDARIVSMPSVKLFEEQSREYRETVLPVSVRKRIVVEAGSSFGWHKYIGLDGQAITMDTFGTSAPAGRLFEAFGFTVDHIVEKAVSMVRNN